jgi:carboxypeptidase Taq
MRMAGGETAFSALMAHVRQTVALGQIMGRLGWDQETMMPRGAAGQRSEEMAALAGVLHARRTDPRIGEWLAAAEPPDAAGAAQLRLIRRGHARAVRVPERLATELARITSISQGVWAEARERDEVAHFLPLLAQVVALKREEAAAIADGGDPYDALLDDFEPGARGAEIAAMFERMRPRLVALRAAVLGSGRQPAPLKGLFAREAQLRLARRLAERFGYDFSRGRLDLAVHPFSSGSGADVRITTRVAEHDPFNCLYSTIHEVGHAVYEQNVDVAYALTPAGQGASMGVHESQSRLFENQIGRSRAFTRWLHGAMVAEFGDMGLDGPEAFHATVNRVAPGHIRTEADEVQYNLHIMLRFDLERELIAGRLAVADLEAAWNARFAADFDLAVDRPAHGLLQDVHWSIGLFGYFPTYTLGNVHAGCLHAALRRELPDLDGQLAAGDLAAAGAWLRERVQRHGAVFESRDLIARAIGGPPQEGPLLDYLEEKFGALYGL